MNLTPAPDYNVFARECHEISASKGWIALKRTDAQLTNLMISELSEALEEFRAKRPLTETYYVGKKKDGTKVEFRNGEQCPCGPDDLVDTNLKPEGIGIELADAIIRIAQYFGTNEMDLNAAREAVAIVPQTDFNEAIADATLYCAKARMHSPEYASHEAVGRGKLGLELAKAFRSIETFCFSVGIDLWAAVAEKNAFNRLRPHLHGNKAI